MHTSHQSVGNQKWLRSGTGQWVESRPFAWYRTLLFGVVLLANSEASAFVAAPAVEEGGSTSRKELTKHRAIRKFDVNSQHALPNATKSPITHELIYGDQREAGTTTDQAISALRIAAEAGNPKAQNDLGGLLADGKLVTTDYQQARYWYEQAAERGDSHAEVNLGTLYCGGLGVPVNCQEGARWVLKAALQGDFVAERTLAMLYMRGEGVSHDHLSAYVWLTRSVRHGDPVSSILLERLRDHMTDNERAEAEERLTVALHVQAD